MPVDPKIAAFCSAEGPEVFRPVAYPTEVWYPDPLDVEAIYSDARRVFETLLARATAADDGTKVGKLLLLRGESGSGKTHLMRAFRTATHRQALGYFGYMQMTTSSGNYGRYILQKLIDSLDVPYYTTATSPENTTGLMRLSTAVAESHMLDPQQVKRLQEDSLNNDERVRLVLDLTDEVVRDPVFEHIPIDLVRAMLFLQSGHPAIRSRVMKYLRAEPLSEHDRTRLAGIAPLDRDESAQTMIERLGQLMWAVHRAALVICVDQLEDIALFDGAADKFRRAMNGLTRVIAQVPTSIVVIACLDDYYVSLRDHLDKSALDRIEKDPAPVTLQSQRTLEEIRAVVGLHLDYLFEQLDVPEDDRPATYPIPDELLREQVKETTRTVLTACKSFRDRCIQAGQMVPVDSTASATSSGASASEADEAMLAFDQAWNDFLANFEQSLLDDDRQMAELLAESIELCADETGADIHYIADTNSIDIEITSVSARRENVGPPRIVRICNHAPQGGRLGRQIKRLLDHVAVRPDEIPIVVRSTEYQPKSPRSEIAALFAQLYQQNGRYVIVRDSDWRTMMAIQPFRIAQQELPYFDTWLRRAKPLARLKSLRELLALDEPHRLRAVAPSEATRPDAVPQPTARRATVRHAETKAARPEPLVEKAEPSRLAAVDEQVLVGLTRNRASEPVQVRRDRWTNHAAFLGSTGSGKTTAVLNVVEQLLMQGIPALLVDRKGDLAGYACTENWNREPDDPLLAQRQRSLRERLDVVVYTPGHPDGRPVTLPVVPDHLEQLPTAERRQAIQQAAQCLAGMLGYKSFGKSAARVSIMIKAIELMTEFGQAQISLDTLIDYISERDDALRSAIGVLDMKLCDTLLEDLQTLSINKQLLFASQGEPLNAEAFFGMGRFRQAEKTRLSVISTKFLGDSPSVQFWVAQLLLELLRWSSKHPSDTLQAVVLFDEADLYLPAVSKPATKEPMEGLLKRARSAGLGVMLATQSPGDLDYKCRENINTWFLGKIKETPAITKMKPMLSECNRDVSGELAKQETGDFFLVQTGRVTAITSQRSLLDTKQLSEHEILRLARSEHRVLVG